MLAILFQEKNEKKMLVFPKNAEKNASILIEKALPLPASNTVPMGQAGDHHKSRAQMFTVDRAIE